MSRNKPSKYEQEPQEVLKEMFGRNCCVSECDCGKYFNWHGDDSMTWCSYRCFGILTKAENL